MSIPSDWRNRIQRYRLPIEICKECGKPNLGRDICPACRNRIVPEGRNIFKELSEGKDPNENGLRGKVKICTPSYGGKERGF